MAVDVVARFVAGCLVFVVWTAPVGDDEGADSAPVRAHSRRCKEPAYCVNGKCRITRRLQPHVMFCLCEAGYFGVRCNEKLPGADQLSVPALPGPWPKAPELPLPSTGLHAPLQPVSVESSTAGEAQSSASARLRGRANRRRLRGSRRRVTSPAAAGSVQPSSGCMSSPGCTSTTAEAPSAASAGLRVAVAWFAVAAVLIGLGRNVVRLGQLL